MNRLIEYTVFSGLVTACRFATCPTSRSSVFVIATTDGVVRPPSWLGITTGSPPCITATTELVVPRSIPIILLIASFSFPNLPETLVLRSPGDCPAILIDARGACSDRTRIRPLSGVQTSHGKRRTDGSIQVECGVVKLFDITCKGTLCHDLPPSFLSFSPSMRGI